MYGIVYITTNLINGKRYVGKHKTNNTNFDNYLGSGKLISHSIKKHGKENFTRDIIDIAYSLKDLNDKEKFWIEYFNAVESDDFYNIASGGDGGIIYKEHPRGMLGKKHSEHKKEKQRILMKKLNEDGIVGTNWKNGHPRGMLNKNHTQETKNKISKSSKGVKKPLDHGLKVSMANKGKKLTEEHKNNLKNYYMIIYPNNKKEIFLGREKILTHLNISSSLFKKILKMENGYTSKKHNHKHLFGLKIEKIPR